MREGGETVSKSIATRRKARRPRETPGAKHTPAAGWRLAVLHKRDGTIREERTYGRDPERHPG